MPSSRHQLLLPRTLTNVSLADPYDGFNRNLLVAPFIPPLLAECGLPTVSHGLGSVGPKYGVTHRHVLRAAGIDVDLSVEQAGRRVADPGLGWSYVDQRSFCPTLHNLIPLRQNVIKRQVLTTVEVLAKPVSGIKKTHLITGYVHNPYPPKYASLGRYAGFESALLVRGTEGGVIPSLSNRGRCSVMRILASNNPRISTPSSLASHRLGNESFEVV